MSGISWAAETDSKGRRFYRQVITFTDDELAEQEAARLFAADDKRLLALAMVVADVVARTENVTVPEARQLVRDRFRQHYRAIL